MRQQKSGSKLISFKHLYNKYGYTYKRPYLTMFKYTMPFADSWAALHRVCVYQTGIIEAHCVLSTADSLSHCVNRPSCVRPAALHLNSKPHITPDTGYTQGCITARLRRRHEPRRKHCRFFRRSCFTAAPGAGQAERRPPLLSLQGCHGNTQSAPLGRSVSE